MDFEREEIKVILTYERKLFSGHYWAIEMRLEFLLPCVRIGVSNAKKIYSNPLSHTHAREHAHVPVIKR